MKNLKVKKIKLKNFEKKFEIFAKNNPPHVILSTK